MTDLKCSVTSCAHNDSMLCSLNQIKVGGRHAVSKRETVCDSFDSRSNAPTNSTSHGEGRMETEIRCDATECKYNDDKMCAASYIYVQGGGDGSDNHTRCDTFKAEGTTSV